MRSRVGGDVSNPGCCLLLNFFLLFGVSFVLGVAFLHYSASMVRLKVVGVFCIVVQCQFQTDRRSNNVSTSPQSSAKYQSAEYKQLCLETWEGRPLQDEGEGHHKLSIFKMFLYIYSTANNSLMHIGVYPNRTSAL